MIGFASDGPGSALPSSERLSAGSSSWSMYGNNFLLFPLMILSAVIFSSLFCASSTSKTSPSSTMTLYWAMGMVMPQRVQPGPLAAAMSMSAPISLGLFMVWIYVLGLLRGIDVHPVNHMFIAAAFFSFHLLFGYSADHLPVEAAFVLSSVVSVVLVVSYLRLVVGASVCLCGGRSRPAALPGGLLTCSLLRGLHGADSHGVGDPHPVCADDAHRPDPLERCVLGWQGSAGTLRAMTACALQQNTRRGGRRGAIG